MPTLRSRAHPTILQFRARPRLLRGRFLPVLSVLSLAFVGFTATVLFTSSEPASAANVAFDQCNGVGGGGGQTVQCDVSIINNLTNDPATTGSLASING